MSSEANLQRVTAPALIMLGDQDVVRVEHAVKMMRLMPNARLVVLPGLHGGLYRRSLHATLAEWRSGLFGRDN
jgi:pimeloyl-ACP methyl ester carboxylesterase